MSNFWRDRSVFVTGGTGFLGGWLVERLLSLGTNVTLLFRDWQINKHINGAIRCVHGDVRDQSLLERAIGESQARTVFHLAAQTQVTVASDNPVSTWDTNVRGTWSLLEACRRCSRVEQVVVASSDKVYGEMSLKLGMERDPFTERDSLNATHPYDVSKACADRLAQTYAATWSLPVAITRCGNLFGGGDRNWARLIPGTVRSLLRGERPVLRGDGKAIRDYLYVEDAVDAYLQLAERMSEIGWATPTPKSEYLSKSSLPYGQAFNFSLGVRLSSLDVARQITSVITSQGYHRGPIDADLRPVIQGTATGEISSQQLDSSLAQRLLGWEPKHTFAEGLAKTIAWYKENL